MVAALLCVAPPADAFCGFYISGGDAKLFNDATLVVLMRDGTRTVLSMQNNYQGPPEDFAMVVPVPVVLSENNVKTLPNTIFDRIDQLTAPRLVEYWEQDPCAPIMADEMRMMAPSSAMAEMADDDDDDDYQVTVEAEFSVGEYQIVILSAKDSGGLDRWLRDNGYKIPAGANEALEPYVQQGTKFFVAKVDIKKVKLQNGRVALSPLRMHYDTHDLRLPLRLGLLNAGDAQDLIVFTLARNQRFEVANYDNVTIPTNLEVTNAVRERFAEFYTALFDRVIATNPRAIVTEYAWQASNCDPCPGPVLSEQDIMTLGADTLGRLDSADLLNFVVTRLHTRYSKETLGDDLVFRTAKPIVGGREIHGDDGDVEQGAKIDSYNNFQGRYIIRHAWTGPIKCAEPRRGIWGGPPEGGKSAVMAARDLAFVQRGDVELASMVKSDLSSLGVLTTPGEETPPQPPPIPRQGGCAGCEVGAPVSTQPAWLALCCLAIAIGVRRRRR
jgi:hypothetical protein